MAVLERTYTIPLRKEYMKAPKYKRAKKAVNAVKAFLVRHMKSEDVRLGRHLNLEIWKHGIKNPPPRIKITTQKDDKGVVRAELYGKPIEFPTEKGEQKKGVMSKVAEAITKPAEKKKADGKTTETKTPTPGTKPEPAKHVHIKQNAPVTKETTPVAPHHHEAKPVIKEELKSGETKIEDAMKKLAEKTATIKKEKK